MPNILPLYFKGILQILTSLILFFVPILDLPLQSLRQRPPRALLFVLLPLLDGGEHRVPPVGLGLVGGPGGGHRVEVVEALLAVAGVRLADVAVRGARGPQVNPGLCKKKKKCNIN